MAAKATVVGDYKSGNLRQAGKDLNYIEAQAQGFSKSFMAGFAGIGASIGGLVALQSVVTFLKDSAQAAMDDQVAMESLAKTLDNVGQGFAKTGVEDFISKMQLATGVADNDLRNAFQKLVTVTGDVEKSQNALKLAMDISAGTGKDLESVSAALAKGYGGQTTALQRLGVGIDAATLKSKDMGAITDALSSKFTGQAAVAASTYQGQMNRITQAVGEAQEAIGYALLQSIDRSVQAIGGTDGIVGAIQDATDKFNAMVIAANQTNDTFETLLRNIPGMSKDTTTFSFSLDLVKQSLLQNLGPLGTFINLLDKFGVIKRISGFISEQSAAQAAAAQSGRAYTSATVQAAIAAGNASGRITQLGDDTENAGDKAWYASKSYLALWESLLNADRAASDFANTSGTVSSAIAQGVKMGDTGAAFWERIRKAAKDAGDATASAGSAGSKAAEDLAIKWKATAASITADMDALTITMGGGGEVIAGAMTKAFQDRLAAFKGVVDAQVGIITQARQALDQYSQSITDTVMGKINFSTVDPTTGEPMTPEQIVQMILGDITNQQNAVTAIAGIATQLPPALTQQIIALPPDAAVALANYLAANPALVEQLTANFNALALATQTLLGDPMAIAFAKVGNRSAIAMIADAKKAIADAGDSFQNFVKSKLDTDITVRVHWAADPWDPPTGSLKGHAMGGAVSAGVPVLVGERGMEMFVPSVDGSIIPNHDLSMAGASAGGNTYQITVQAGVGDPRAIGKTVVEAITLFERSSGPVFARA